MAQVQHRAEQHEPEHRVAQLPHLMRSRTTQEVAQVQQRAEHQEPERRVAQQLLLLQLLPLPLRLRVRLPLPLRLPMRVRLRLRLQQNSTTGILHESYRECFQICS